MALHIAFEKSADSLLKKIVKTLAGPYVHTELVEPHATSIPLLTGMEKDIYHAPLLFCSQSIVLILRSRLDTPCSPTCRRSTAAQSHHRSCTI